MSLSERLSRTLPSQAVRLAHEPLIGLHFLASHSQQRTSPALANIFASHNRSTRVLNEAVLDARDIRHAIDEVEAAGKEIERLRSALAGAMQNLGGGSSE